jgi:YjbE family integral membrane protein
VDSVSQYLVSSFSDQLLLLGADDLGQAKFWIAALRIIVINILLSGDNAVVIALACRGLPHRQRLWGMVIGAGVAVILLIGFTGVVARLMLLPYLKVGGGLALLYIAAKLLLPEAADETEVQAEAHLWRAVRIVVVADIVMSLDNIIAVAAAAQGDVALLVVGLTVSIPVIVAGAALIMALLDRVPILVWLGAALLGWIAGDAIASDPAVSDYLIGAFGETLFRDVEWVTAGAGTLLVVAAGALWRRARLSKARASAAGGQVGKA